MESDLQTMLLFGLNLLVLTVSALIGILVTILRESLKALRVQLRELDMDVRQHKLDVAKTHVSRTELDNLGGKLFVKLDQMRSEQQKDFRELLSKLESKADK